MFEATTGIVRASFTVGLPQNTENESSAGRALVPRRRDSMNFTIVHFGMESPNRSDRRRGLIIPCCDDSSLDFDTRHTGGTLMSGILQR